MWLKLCTKKYSYRLFSFLDKCGFISGVLSEDSTERKQPITCTVSNTID